MEELHPNITEISEWFWRILMLVAIVFTGSYLYSSVQDVQALYLNIDGNVDVLELSLVLLLKIASIGLFAGIGGFTWGTIHGCLRLSDGFLESHYKVFRWPIVQKIDLRTVGEAGIDHKPFSYSGRRRADRLTIFFAGKKSVDAMTEKEAEELEEKYVQLPTGVTKEAAEPFLQKVNEEIKRVLSYT